MKRFIARRLMQGVVLLFMVATIVFFLGRLTGNPVDLMLPEDATAEDRAQLTQTLGLDGPLSEQFLIFIGKALHGDLGTSIRMKQPAAQGLVLEIKRLAIGDLQLTMLHDGGFRLDGGAMFGTVPRPLWEKLAPADDRNRIQLAMRPLLVEADWGRLLVDCGAGDKMAPKQADIYALSRERHLDHALVDAGLTAASIDVALATHLHFDHFGGATVRDGDRLKPRFPKAQYAIRGAE